MPSNPSSESQIAIPPAFIALFVPPGRVKPTASWAHIAERHEFCEDLATMLTDTARARLFELHISEEEVLERTLAGLRENTALVSADEALWVTRRLAELLEWPLTGELAPDAGPRN